MILLKIDQYIIIVEGITDKIYIDKMFKYSEVYDINKCKIDFITCKGKDEIIKSKPKIEKMKKYDNPYIIVCYDIDSKNSDDNIKNEKIKKFIFENSYNEIYFEKNIEEVLNSNSKNLNKNNKRIIAEKFKPNIKLIEILKKSTKTNIMKIIIELDKHFK